MADNVSNVLARLGEARILPVVELDSSEAALPLGKALMAGGLPVAEITFRSAPAAESIGILRERIPEMLVGAGTVLTIDQVEQAHRAGSRFVVTPGFNPAVVEACIELGLPVLPGINNPTGVERAMGFGLDAVKFFPAEASGGVPFLKALRPLPVDPVRADRRHRSGQPRRLPGAAERPRHAAGAGFVSPALVRASGFDEIARLAGEAVALAARNV